jgi:hypothetical protein
LANVAEIDKERIMESMIKHKNDKKGIHIISNKGSWAVVKDKNTRATRVFRTKRKAVEFGRSIAKKENGIFYIHGKDGQVQSKNITEYHQENGTEYGKGL